MYEIYMNIGNYQGKDFSNYEVSNLGNVRNAKTKRVLKTRTYVNNRGYTAVDVNLYDTNHKHHSIVVARLVISTFKANPDNKPTVNHINEDSTDNRLNNLEWATYSENNTHNGRAKRVAKKAAATMKANGTYTKIAQTKKANGIYTKIAQTKKANGTYDKIAQTKKANGTYDKIAENLKIKVYCVELNRTFDSAKDAADWLDNKQARANITACCKNRQKSAYGYTWCYADDLEGDVQ